MMLRVADICEPSEPMWGCSPRVADICERSELMWGCSPELRRPNSRQELHTQHRRPASPTRDPERSEGEGEAGTFC